MRFTYTNILFKYLLFIFLSVNSPQVFALTITGNAHMPRCIDGYGKIDIGVTQGEAPYTYQLSINSSMQPLLEEQTTLNPEILFASFCIPGNTYYVKVTDASLEVRTLVLVIPFFNHPLLLSSIGASVNVMCDPAKTIRLDCNRMQLSGVNFSVLTGVKQSGSPKYTLDLKNITGVPITPGTYTNLSLSQIENFPFVFNLPLCPNNMTTNSFVARIIVTDSCGYKDSVDIKYPSNGTVNYGNTLCNFQTEVIFRLYTTLSFYHGSQLTATVPVPNFYKNGHTGTIGIAKYIVGTQVRMDSININVNCKGLNYIDTIDNRFCYDFFITDDCCRRLYQSLSCPPPLIYPPLSAVISKGCLDSTANIQISAQTRVEPIVWILDSGRVNFMNSQIFDQTIVVTPVSLPITGVSNSGSINIGNLPTGTYRIVLSDQCSHKDTVRFTISPGQTRHLHPSLFQKKTCDLNNNQGAIWLALNNSVGSESMYNVLLKGSNGSILKAYYNLFIGANDTIKFDTPNAGLALSPGTYTVTYESFGGANSVVNLFGSCPAVGEDTITLLPYSLPRPEIIAVSCVTDSLKCYIKNQNGGGVPPYTYTARRILPLPAGIVSNLYDSTFAIYLHPQENISYEVSMTDICGNTNLDTIVVHPNICSSPLPIKFEYFNARKEGVGVVKLDWKSSDAGEVLGYKIERSQDGSNWQQVGQVNAGMLDIYGYTDNIGTLSGTLYYRIRAINQDGSSKYTEIRIVRIADSGAKLSIYPTITGGMINVVSSMGLLQRVRVTDGSGRMIIDRVLTGTQSVQLDISNYAKGIYYVEAVTAEERKVEKVLRK